MSEHTTSRRISSRSENEFHRLLDAALADGWSVIPGTLYTASMPMLSQIASSWPAYYHLPVQTADYFFVVVSRTEAAAKEAAQRKRQAEHEATCARWSATNIEFGRHTAARTKLTKAGLTTYGKLCRKTSTELVALGGEKLLQSVNELLAKASHQLKLQPEAA